LKESEEKFKALFKGSPVPALTWQKVGEDLQLIDYNKALLEYSQDDMRNYLGTNASVFFRNRPVLLEELYRCFEEKISITREIKYYVNIFEEERDFLAKFAYIAPDLVLLYVDDITERKEAEQKLKESEETFRSITEQSFMGIIVIQDGVFKYFNERAADINGYSVEEISNWQPYEFSKLIHPDDKDFVMNQARKKQEGDTDVVSHHQYRIIKKNEEIIWVENFSKTINYQGKPADLVMTIDITEKILSEQKIKESEKILKDFIHNATDSISIWDSNLNLIDINKAAADPWDSPNEPESGISMLRLAPLLKETERYEDYLKVIETGEPVSFDNVQIPPNIGERYFNIKAFKVGNGLGIIGTEITEHIRFEQELKESEEKFRTIAEQSFMGIVIVHEGKIKYMNKVLAKMSEYPLDEMLQ